MKILGIDPGVARVGWGCIEKTGSNIIAGSYGCIETSKNLPVEERLKSIFEILTEIIKKEKPDTVAIEELFFSVNAKTAIPVGQARGVVLLVASLAKKPVISYTPSVVKNTICGSGSAEKTQVQKMVTRLLRLPGIPTPDDTADALAIALTHAYSYKLRSIL